MKIEIELTEFEWNVLRPLLAPKLASRVVNPLDDVRVDYDRLLKCKNGKKISSILKDGYWGKNMDRDIIFVHELKAITKEEFLKHRQAGFALWDSLKDFIKSL